MATTTLVGDLIAAGREIIMRLEQAGVDVDTALWVQDEESGDAAWSATAVGDLTPELTSGAGDSSIDQERFVELLGEHLRTAPPAWDPFTPR